MRELVFLLYEHRLSRVEHKSRHSADRDHDLARGVSEPMRDRIHQRQHLKEPATNQSCGRIRFPFGLQRLWESEGKPCPCIQARSRRSLRSTSLITATCWAARTFIAKWHIAAPIHLVQSAALISIGF
jgi:hypothetical protein